MHKRIVNQCQINLEIKTEGPLLIKSGAPGIEGPDMAPVLTFRGGLRPQPYIPGSSLKGVLRSHAERIARTLCWETDDWRIGACNPFLTSKKETDWRKSEGFCGAKFERRKDVAKKARERGEQPEDLSTPAYYRDSCPACKVFGSTFLIGRLAVPDAYIPEGSSYRTERRDGVGIDRFTGGSSPNAKFDLEVVTEAKFEARLQLVNFELWQLGWLAYVMRDLCEGWVGIGSGKSRGLGQVSAQVRQVELVIAKHCLPQQDGMHLWGLSALEPEEARLSYGYWQEGETSIALEAAEPIGDSLGLRVGYHLAGAAVASLWRQVAPIATLYFQRYKVPEAMRFIRQPAGEE